MTVQSLISLIIIVLVTARAVNILAKFKSKVLFICIFIHKYLSCDANIIAPI